MRKSKLIEVQMIEYPESVILTPREALARWVYENPSVTQANQLARSLANCLTLGTFVLYELRRADGTVWGRGARFGIDGPEYASFT